jgi:hypothetical protein
MAKTAKPDMNVDGVMLGKKPCLAIHKAVPKPWPTGFISHWEGDYAIVVPRKPIDQSGVCAHCHGTGRQEGIEVVFR